jgi:hypothetical protein
VAENENRGQSQKVLEQTVASTSTGPAQGPLIDFHNDMKDSLLLEQELEQQDTSDEEFVDAEG